MKKKDKIDFMWIEKYRPRTLDDVVLENSTRKQLESFISDGQIPHLLFYGSPGSGKTTIARILIDYLIKDESDIMILNGSEQRGIDIVRNTIIEFLKYKPVNSKHKIIFIDEADSMTEQAFKALRRVFEEYYENGRFIMTCNYVHLIPDPIRSRCSEFHFKELPLDFVINRCYQILQMENVQYNEEDVKKIVNYAYPDMRKVINNLQKFSIDNQLVIEDENDLMDLDIYIVMNTLNFFNFVLTKDKQKSKQILDMLIKKVSENQQLDFINIFKQIFNNDSCFPIIKVITNKYLNELNRAVFPNMHFISYLYECEKVINEMGN